jgi:hypothetical protein
MIAAKGKVKEALTAIANGQKKHAGGRRVPVYTFAPISTRDIQCYDAYQRYRNQLVPQPNDTTTNWYHNRKIPQPTGTSTERYHNQLVLQHTSTATEQGTRFPELEHRMCDSIISSLAIL